VVGAGGWVCGRRSLPQASTGWSDVLIEVEDSGLRTTKDPGAVGQHTLELDDMVQAAVKEDQGVLTNRYLVQKVCCVRSVVHDSVCDARPSGQRTRFVDRDFAHVDTVDRIRYSGREDLTLETDREEDWASFTPGKQSRTPM